ncbi:hypothetical protein PODOV084v1_p0034 [Vibrio phage 340E47.2]|nr:hypothetical protein PODOV084v1_p0034 [Vibrio phage 340E47.2]QZI91939.1 hypothetical protein PODOV077v1_p0028 [Vibrio phage 5P1a]
MNGKGFEKLIKESCVLQGVDITRLFDAGSYVGGEQTGTGRRFTTKNICDFILFDEGKIVFVEAKHRKQSITFESITQRKGLQKKYEASSQGKLLDCGLLVWFGNVEQCWWVHVGALDELQFITGKKSFNAKDCMKLSEEHPALCMLVDQYVPTGKRAMKLDMKTFVFDC